MLITLNRTRSRETVGPTFYARGLKRIWHFEDFGGQIPNPPVSYDALSTLLTIISWRYTSTIEDEIVYLSPDYKERTAILASPEYLAWKKSFKNVNHVNEGYLFLPFPVKIVEGAYSWYYRGFHRMFSEYYEGYPFYAGVNPLNSSGFGSLVNGVNYAKTLPDYIAASNMDSNRILNMCNNLLSDPKLLGLKTFSVANFLYEMKETLNLVNIFKTKLTSFKDHNNNFLAYNFGIKPLITDLKALWGILTNLNKRIDDWNASVASLPTYNSHVLVSKEKIHVDTVITQNGFINHLVGDIDVTIRGHAYFRPEPINSLDYIPLLKKLTGLDKPLSIIWEAIPYSFLVDWIFHVGDVLDNFENSSNILRISHQVLGYSVKVQGSISNTYKMQTVPWQGSTIDWSRSVIIGGASNDPIDGGVYVTNINNYRRQIVDPSSIGALNPLSSATFQLEQSGTHIALAASLALQRVF